MEIIAESKYVRQSPRKLRMVASAVCGLSLSEAVLTLGAMNKKASDLILQTLKQARGNAVNNFQMSEESLKIKTLEINEGPRYKRMDKSHRSFRWGTVRKKTAHIRLVLEGEKGEKKPVKEVRVKSEKKSEKNEKKGVKKGILRRKKEAKKDGAKN